MPRTLLRSTAIAATIAILGLTAGCARIRDHKGYVVDSTLINTVAPGIDNRESVEKTLGRPSFAGQFDKDRTWYYVARDTRQVGYRTPKRRPLPKSASRHRRPSPPPPAPAR
jgi:outer membrane protein assembly factor BamE (lipoprotein component of BamABCDE complex)